MLSLSELDAKWEEYKLEVGVALMVLLSVFGLGWYCATKYNKPVTVVKTITVDVPIKVDGKETPQKEVAHNVFAPAVNHKEQPMPPAGGLDHPTSTTTIDLKMPQPLSEVKVFYQNKLNYSQSDSEITAWVDGRAWATDSGGNLLGSLQAETSFSRDSLVHIPFKTKIVVQTPPSHPNAISFLYNLQNKSFGLDYDRDFGPLRTGVLALQVTEPLYGKKDNQVWIKGGIVF